MAKTKPQSRPADQIEINFDTTPVFYTDNINIVSNKSGVVLNVMQRFGNTNKVRIVSRIGMSREQAKDVVEKLGKLLIMTGSANSGKELN